MGGGSQESSSRPLSGAERADIYHSAMGELSASAPGIFSKNGNGFTVNAPAFVAPDYVSSGAPRTLTGGDYNALESSLLKGNLAGLDYAKAQDLKGVNQDLANRGIWSSGLADTAVRDREAAYAPQYAKAGADATAQRYSLQSGETQSANAFNQQEAGARNTFNSTNAQQKYNAEWAPANFLQGLWNGTGGAVSNSSGLNVSL